MITTNSVRGRVALMAGHCAGMIDLVALPVWVGALIAHYRFDPQQAGMLASLFLFGAVLASLVVAPRFNRLSGRLVAVAGFGVAAAGFAFASTTTEFGALALAHGLCGMAAGAALSVTHGTVARSGHPHRLFALLGIALGIFAIVFMAATPGIVAQAGGPALFKVFAGVMLVGAVVAALAFPQPDGVTPQGAAAALGPIPRAVWFGIVGISCMTLVQAMTFSFLERVGNDRGFSPQAIHGVLVAMGLVALAPPVLAALLERRLAARTVMLVGPVLQALLCLVIMNVSAFMPYAVAVCLFAPVLIFTHVFAFGLLARLDPSGRAMAATPAMVMVGAAIGPFLGGTLVKNFGYGAIGVAALVIAVCAVYAFSRLPKAAPTLEPVGAPA
jgi:predicted MFS family arabinose efflux permease